jgi:hypothetical protein
MSGSTPSTIKHVIDRPAEFDVPPGALRTK